MKTLISNEYRTVSTSRRAITREVNQQRGLHLDPLEVLIRLEELAEARYETDLSTSLSRDEYIRYEVAIAVNDL